MSRVVPHTGRAVLVRAIAGHALGIDLLIAPAPAASRISAPRSIRKRPCFRSFSCGVSVIRATGRPQASTYLVVEIDAIVMLGHVVQHHRDRHRMVEIVAIVLLGGSAPGGRVRQPPVDRQRNADARTGDVAPADMKPRDGVVFVELEARGADVAAARPGVDRIVIGADRGAVFVEGHVAPDEIAAVGEAVGKAAGLRQQQQPRGLDRPAGEDEDIRLLLDRDRRRRPGRPPT